MDSIINILLIAGVIYLIIYKFISNKNYKNFDDYLSKKRASLTTEKYRKFLDQKIAEVNSEIRIREHKVRVKKKYKPDPLLLDALNKLEEEQRKLG